MSQPDAFLRIEGIRKIFKGGITAVADFTLGIARGEFVTLLGPSGCGKTTLLRIVAGLEFPDQGRIVLDGQDITRVPAHKRPVNMVFQRVTLFPHLDVLENVAFGLRIQGLARHDREQRVSSALQLMRLPGFERRAVQTLSGGQAQRVALARALVNRPRALLFDEPLSALDLQVRRDLQVELKDIHREIGGTFVYVTHDQEEAMAMSDRIVVMKDGRIFQVGTPAELYHSPGSLFVASFVGSSNIWKAKVVGLDATGTTVEAYGRTLRARKTPGLLPGDTAWIILRAESLALSVAADSDPDNPTRLRGVVADVRFTGPAVRYRVDVGGGQILVVSQPAQSGPLLSEGQQVAATWNSDQIMLVTTSGEEPGENLAAS